MLVGIRMPALLAASFKLITDAAAADACMMLSQLRPTKIRMSEQLAASLHTTYRAALKRAGVCKGKLSSCAGGNCPSHECHLRPLAGEHSKSD
jgi:hypothetical protein